MTLTRLRHRLGCGESAFGRPSSTDASIDQVRGHLFFSRPLSNRLPTPLEDYVLVATGIICLFASSGPLAILNAVSFVVINTLQGIARRGIAHILQKAVKGLPFIGYRYATPTVMDKGDIRGLSTTVHHMAPDSLGAPRMWPGRIGLWFTVRLDAYLPLQTLATSNVPVSQSICSGANDIAAFTLAPPKGCRSGRESFVPAKSQDGQSSKRAAFNINEVMDRWFWDKLNAIFVVAHSVFSNQKMVWVRLGDALVARLRAVSILSPERAII